MIVTWKRSAARRERLSRYQCCSRRLRQCARCFASEFRQCCEQSLDWTLLPNGYVVSEIDANLDTLPGEGARRWDVLRPSMTLVSDVLTFEWIAIFGQVKDRPILYTAAACADVLLTLDRRSFRDLLGGAFYGLALLKPGDFLQRERAAGRLSLVA